MTPPTVTLCFLAHANVEATVSLPGGGSGGKRLLPSGLIEPLRPRKGRSFQTFPVLASTCGPTDGLQRKVSSSITAANTAFASSSSSIV